ncbi:MAG: oligosaccharide flippase family protein [Thiotrichaceae bacterium]|nr:oligosaccharide flippase family protein [Thiotrichaceae bacterium]
MSNKFNKEFFVHFLAVFSGKVGASGLGFIVSLAVARLLGPENFGLFSFFLMWALLGSCFIGDIFADAMIRNYSVSIQNNKNHASSVLLNALLIRLFFGTLLAVTGALLSNYIALEIFNNEDYTIPIMYGCAGALAISLWTFILSMLQASEAFHKHGLISPLVNLLRLIAIPILFNIGMFAVEPLIMVFVASYVICGVTAIFLMRGRFKDGKILYPEIKKQLSFSKWITLSLICIALINFLAIPALGYYATNLEVGLYAAGANLLIVFEHITNAIVTIQYPKISKLKTLHELRSFNWKTLKFSIVIVALLAPLIYFIKPFIILVYGAEYAASSLIFQVLCIGLLSTMITQPLNLLFLVQNKSHYWGYMSLISLCIWIIAGYILIPQYAAIGAATATLIARVSYSFISSILLWKTLRPKKELNLS